MRTGTAAVCGVGGWSENAGYLADACFCLFVRRNGFQKLDRIKDANHGSRQLEELTIKMRDQKRLFVLF
jgi:hypothetical protein